MQHSAGIARRRIWLMVSAVIGVVGAASAIVQLIAVGNDCTNWDLSEWLINYHAGFIRRGLPGQLVWEASIHGFPPYDLIVALGLTGYALCIGCILFGAFGRGWGSLPLLISFLLLAPALGGFWLRKDSWLVCGLYFAVSVYNWRPALRAVVANVVCCVCVLSHELFVFLAFPSLLLIYSAHDSEKGSEAGIDWAQMRLNLARLTPALVVAALCFFRHGTDSQAQNIWDSWRGLSLGTYTSQPQGEVQALAWKLPMCLRVAGHIFHAASHGIYEPLAWVLTYFFTVSLATAMGRWTVGCGAFPSRTFRRIVGFQLLAMLPLFVVGPDLGRWLFFIMASSMVLLSRCGPRELRYFDIIAKRRTVFDPLKRLLRISITLVVRWLWPRPWLAALAVVLCGVPQSKWTVERFWNSAPAGVLLQKLASSRR